MRTCFRISSREMNGMLKQVQHDNGVFMIHGFISLLASLPDEDVEQHERDTVFYGVHAYRWPDAIGFFPDKT